jgi:hypothetical protein
MTLSGAAVVSTPVPWSLPTMMTLKVRSFNMPGKVPFHLKAGLRMAFGIHKQNHGRAVTRSCKRSGWRQRQMM